MAVETVSQATQEHFGGDSVSGGWGGILKTTGIDIRGFPQVMDGTGTATVQKDGHLWTIVPWEGGGGFAIATRPQTDAEIERDRRRLMRNTLISYFSKDRLLMCADIAELVARLSAQLHPDQPPARSVRRSIRRKLDRLAQIQLELLWNRSADSSQFERELKQLGTW